MCLTEPALTKANINTVNRKAHSLRNQAAIQGVTHLQTLPPGTAGCQQKFRATHLINSDMLTVPYVHSVDHSLST